MSPPQLPQRLSCPRPIRGAPLGSRLLTRRQGPGSGFSLLELTVALTLVAVLCGLGAPLWRVTVDRWAVRSVRDRAAIALHRARLEARRWGGANLEIDAEAGSLRLLRAPSDSLIWEDSSPGDHRVRVVLPRGAGATTLTFDALGLGVVASRTLLFRRGRAEARLIVSSRGRGTRR
jgi:prepilin-type N-terminal cleavage/methylation domain-containing protein